MNGGITVKFFNISNTTAFLNTVLSCSGDVYCRDSSGALQDLKQAARQLTACSWLTLPEALDEIDVVVQHPSDGLRLHRYMMEACRAR